MYSDVQRTADKSDLKCFWQWKKKRGMGMGWEAGSDRGMGSE